MAIPLSKTLAPVDFDALVDELSIVDASFNYGRPQHEMRRWEYAMALAAYQRWGEEAADGDPYCYDVGGAGSPFHYMIPSRIQVIDPDAPIGMNLEAYVDEHPRLASCVFCLSVLEHVDDLDRFLYHLSCLVAPGGLLFLTMDYCDQAKADPPIDTYHFHWMRKRIFGLYSLTLVAERFLDWEFSLLGGEDRLYHGPQVYDYTFASLALVKRA